VNAKRILLAGLAAGLVLDALDATTNAVVFGASWARAYKALALPEENAGIPVFWMTFDLLAGVLLAWLYAAMRPRFGPGPRTAIYAALVEWTLIHFTLYSHLVDGVFPARVLLGTSVCELVSALVAGLVAGKLYSEPSRVETVPTPHAATSSP
jgi:hypothetical protein